MSELQQQEEEECEQEAQEAADIWTDSDVLLTKSKVWAATTSRYLQQSPAEVSVSVCTVCGFNSI